MQQGQRDPTEEGWGQRHLEQVNYTHRELKIRVSKHSYLYCSSLTISKKSCMLLMLHVALYLQYFGHVMRQKAHHRSLLPYINILARL